MDPLLDLDELVADWTLIDAERDLVSGKRGSTRLGFALQLKFYGRHGRFVIDPAELSDDVVEFVARQVDVDAGELAGYEWPSRAVRFHRAQIRDHFGFRESTIEDADRGVDWLAVQVCERERAPAVVRNELSAWFRRERLEPPTDGRVDRLVRSALHRGELAVTARITERLTIEVRDRLDDLIAQSDDVNDEAVSAWATMLAEPSDISLNTMLVEIDKLNSVRFVGIPAGVLSDVAPSVTERWRTRAAVESPSHLRTHPDELRWALLATTLVVRECELVDVLVDLLIKTVHRIGARASRRVTKELTNAFKKVRGKESILFSIASAALDSPDDAVRSVVFPAVSGGEKTLKELVHEYKTKGPEYEQTVRATLKASYTGHYRRGLIDLLNVLEFRTNLLAGRDEALLMFDDALNEGPGAPGRARIVVGHRGMGKTVMLNGIEDLAKQRGWITISETAHEGLIHRINEEASNHLRRLDPQAAETNLTGITMPMGLGSLSWATEDQYARMTGTRTLLSRLADVAADTGTGVLVTVDEVHAAQPGELRELTTIIQHGIREEREIAFAAAGLPAALSERLLNDPVLTFLRRSERVDVGPVSAREVREALREPIVNAGRDIGDDALDAATNPTGGYPFLIQLVGYHAWRQQRDEHRITIDDVEQALPDVADRLGRQSSTRPLTP